MDRYTGKEALEDDEYCDQYGTARERWVKSSVLDRTIDQLTHANGLLDEIENISGVSANLDYEIRQIELINAIFDRRNKEGE